MTRMALVRAGIIAGTCTIGGAIAPVLAAQPTVAAVPNDTTIAVTARSASAESFRPAPLPDEGMSQPTQVASSDEGPNLHPDLLSMHEQSTGVLGDTSAEYGHTERVRPAGGMSLSIPMN